MTESANPFLETARRNLTAVERHRPELWQQLQRVEQSDRYRFWTGPTGEVTLVEADSQGRAQPCIPGGAPRDFMHRVKAQLDLTFFRTLGLAGVGDGSLIALISLLRPSLGAWRGQPVLVVEPDLQLLLAALHLHDLSDPFGALSDSRFFWCVGPDWERQLQQHLMDDAFIQTPSKFLFGGVARPEIELGLARFQKNMARAHAQLQFPLAERYAQRSNAECAALLSRHPPRRPRVLLTTSRFTTVLQYTARHAAQAFEQLGFETQVLMEQADHHRLSPLQVFRALDQFAPDLVVVANHLSCDFEWLYPEGLPYVCWVQDECQDLARAGAGEKLRAREFVWLRQPEVYRDQFDYPPDKLVPSTALTVARTPAPARSKPVDDLVYFSHGSWSLERIVANPLGWVEVHGLERERVEKLASGLAQRYLSDESVPNLYEFCHELVPELRLPPPPDCSLAGRRIECATSAREPIELYARALSQARGLLHRQQGLRWAARVADALGLRLSVYGNGWDELPEFSRFARGPADYATELVGLSQAARINLALEPWVVVSHWRGLDCLAAGSVLAARSEPYREGAFTALAERLVGFSPLPRCTEEAVARAGDDPQSVLRLIERIQGIPFGSRDPVEYVVQQLEQGTPAESIRCLPGLHHCQFDSEQQLRGRVERVLEAPEAVRSHALELRAAALEHYDYAVGLRGLCDHLAESLSKAPEARSCPTESAPSTVARGTLVASSGAA